MTEKGRGEGAKERGNDAFKRQDYAEAVGCYTEAILAESTNHVYFLNRSMAYMKLNKFEDAERDASASLRLGGDNIKAYFRRGSARKQLSKWADAKQDFEKVFELDSTNVEAEMEIAFLREQINIEEKSTSRKPLDVGDLKSSKLNSTNGTPASNNVEAARKFLEQVGMSDQENAVKHTKIPDKFPGETGSFLKEVSTRKLEKKPSELAATVTISLENSITTPAVNYTLRPEQTLISSMQLSNMAATPVMNGSTAKMKLSAYDFYRRLRQCSSSADSTVKYSNKLKLFASLDVPSIPSMLGSLLEPELLADILEALSRAGEEEKTALVDMMSILPSCERFETACLFLDNHEKSRAVSIIKKLRKSESTILCDRLDTLWKIQS